MKDIARPKVPLIIDGKALREPGIRLHNPYGEYVDVKAMIEHHRKKQESGKSS